MSSMSLHRKYASRFECTFINENKFYPYRYALAAFKFDLEIIYIYIWSSIKRTFVNFFRFFYKLCYFVCTVVAQKLFFAQDTFPSTR
jgi:hypothetical protein